MGNYTLVFEWPNTSNTSPPLVGEASVPPLSLSAVREVPAWCRFRRLTLVGGCCVAQCAKMWFNGHHTRCPICRYDMMLKGWSKAA